MATGKKGAKGNKTAHVLNLLTAPGEAAPPPAEEAAEGVPQAQIIKKAIENFLQT